MNDDGDDFGVMNIKKRNKTIYLLMTLILGMGLNPGCVWFEETRQKIELGVEAGKNPYADSVAFQDTIGSHTYYQGLTPMRVRGYGLVVGLGKNGSSDCPKHVYDRLLQSLYKQHRFASSIVGVKNITPEALIDDLDTAVVLVQGDIPPAAVRGTRFDVSVRAISGTQTKSLRGGRLYTTDLEMFKPVSPTTSIMGRILAHARGPVFLNPFSQRGAATQTSELQSIIIGGGIVTEQRRIRLVLMEPSYRQVRRIEQRINLFVSGSEKTADAISPSFVQLTIPEKYHNDTGHFLTLLRSLYLTRNPRAASVIARKLAAEIVHPSAPHAQISSCLEGLGRDALPVLNKLYAHSKEYVSFFAAVAGLRLGDHIAGDAMIMHAENPSGKYRFKAIRALTETRGMGGAAICLRRLLDNEDSRIQVAAYEALIKRGDPSIRSKIIGGDNFHLDLVPTSRPSFIYVKRRESRRIALFGNNILSTTPLLYRAPDGCITMSAAVGSEEMTLLRVNVATGRSSPPIPVAMSVKKWIELMGMDADVDLNDNVIGLGLDYGEIVRAIYHLSQDKAINAKFVLEQPNVADLFGPPRERGRPESEL